MAYELPKEMQEKLKEVVGHYPDPMSAILPGLHMVMEHRGWVDKESCDHVAEVIQVPPIHVYEAMTFYTYFPRKPVGKYNLQFCHNIACHLRGAQDLIAYLEEKHGIREGEVTEDGLFSLTKVECLGACGNAPMMLVRDKYHEDLTVEMLDELIENWKKEAGNGHK